VTPASECEEDIKPDRSEVRYETGGRLFRGFVTLIARRFWHGLSMTDYDNTQCAADHICYTVSKELSVGPGFSRTLQMRSAHHQAMEERLQA